MMLGGNSPSYKTMYEKFIAVAKEELFFRPMTMGDEDILIAGAVNRVAGQPTTLTPELQHLACFAGGMVAIAGKIFNRPEEVKIGGKLADGCVWAYRATVSGIMPETFTAVPCESKTTCKWNQQAWMNAIDPNADEATIRERVASKRLAPGFTGIQDERYLLRYLQLFPSHKWNSLSRVTFPTDDVLTMNQARSNRIRLHHAQNNSRSILGPTLVGICSNLLWHTPRPI